MTDTAVQHGRELLAEAKAAPDADVRVPLAATHIPLDLPPAAPDDGCLSTEQVRKLAGITYRQADHWTRRGLLGTPKHPGSGWQRRWTRDEARQVVILAALVRAGMRADAAAKHAGYVSHDTPWTDIGMPGVSIRVHTARLLRNAGLLDQEVRPDSNDLSTAPELSEGHSTPPHEPTLTP